MKKTSRQPRSGPPSAISAPPASGPSAVPRPTVVPSAPKARPRSSPRNICWIRPETCGLISPPEMPWNTRAAISSSAVGASPEMRAGHGEPGDADLEHQPSAVVVAEPPGEHRHQPERRACSR